MSRRQPAVSISTRLTMFARQTKHRATTVALALALPAFAAGAQARSPLSIDLAPAVRGYVTTALDSLEATAMRRSSTDWRTVRDSTFVLAAGAQRVAQAYGALNWALRRVDKHSFLQAPWPWVSPELVAGRLGYVRIPFHPAGSRAALADTVQVALRDLEAAGARCWVVDLRDNGGGNMWPMLAGIGPLLTDSVAGVTRRDGAVVARSLYVNGEAIDDSVGGTRQVIARVEHPYVVRHPRAPVAVLINGGTASSAEAIAIAFRTRPDTRFFGAPTAGYTTENRGIRLADGANMVVTIDAMRDSEGRAYAGPMAPDVSVPMPAGFAPATAVDAVARTASTWLLPHPACSAPGTER